MANKDIDNYREVPIKLNGQNIMVGGFSRYEMDSNEGAMTRVKNKGVEAVVSLAGNYKKQFENAGMDPKFYTSDTTAVYDWFNTPYKEGNEIKPEVYDAVYEAVVAAQKEGKKIAIHCGAGDGRTGTALSSLKLRELLEEAYNKNPKDFNSEQNKSEEIHMHHGVNGSLGGNVKVTPLVKQAIEEVRTKSVNADGSIGHHDSVESRNDVETLMLYEKHLRDQLVLQHKKAQESKSNINSDASTAVSSEDESQKQGNKTKSLADESRSFKSKLKETKSDNEIENEEEQRKQPFKP